MSRTVYESSLASRFASLRSRLRVPSAHPRAPSLSRSPAMDEDLPRAHIKRLVKHKLLTLDNVDAKGQSFEPNIQKEALTAYGECAKIFIHYLTATANDVCRDHKRSTISDADVLAAIEECDFGELVDDVRATLDAFRDAKRTKKARDAEAKETRDEGDDDEVEKRDDGGGGDGGGDGAA